MPAKKLTASFGKDRFPKNFGKILIHRKNLKKGKENTLQASLLKTGVL